MELLGDGRQLPLITFALSPQDIAHRLAKARPVAGAVVAILPLGLRIVLRFHLDQSLVLPPEARPIAPSDAAAGHAARGMPTA